MDPAKVQLLAAWAIPILFAITIHEVAHGWVARYFGDDTAARLGRLSLNPLKHVDMVGTVLVPVLLWLTSPLIFGWAKPVPVVASRMRHPRRDMAVVALAGPAANLAMCLFWAAMLKAAIFVAGSATGTFVAEMAKGGIVANLVLMLLNLLPIPPLDGSRVLNGILPERYAQVVDRMEPYGLIGVFFLLFLMWRFGIFALLLGVAITVVLGLFGVPLSAFG